MLRCIMYSKQGNTGVLQELRQCKNNGSTPGVFVTASLIYFDSINYVQELGILRCSIDNLVHLNAGFTSSDLEQSS